MGTTSTPNLTLIKPNPFEEQDTWGALLNSNWDKVDALGTVSAKAIAAVTPAADKLAYFTSGTAAAVTPFTAFARTLVDDADAATMRSTLGLGSLATLSSVNLTTNVTDVLPVANGGTGGSTAAAARTALSVPAIADLAAYAPVSHAHTTSQVTGLDAALAGKAASVHTHVISDVSGLQGALDAKAPLASPGFSGTPTAPTAGGGTNNTQIATTAFVQSALGGASSFTLLTTLTTTSGTSQVASGLTLTGYKQLYVVFVAVSPTANAQLRCAGIIVSPAAVNSENVTGRVEIDLTTGMGTALGRQGTTGATAYDGSFGVTTASTSVTFDWSAAVSFDAGTIYLYGVK